jgi:hypothetical protein
MARENAGIENQGKERVAMKGRGIAIVLAIVLLAPAMVFGMASFEFPVVAPVISFVQGDVAVKGHGAADWAAAEVGRLLASGDTVRTGPSSRAEVSCATGKMRLYENTVIIVPEVVQGENKKDVRQMILDDGTGLFNIRKRGVENGFEVHTSNIIAGVKGTIFGVLREKKRNFSRVAVYSGVVEVTDPQRTPETLTRLGKGETLGVEGEDFGDREYFDPHSPWYLWKKMDSIDLKMLDKPWRESFRSKESNKNEPECDPVTDNDGNPIYY